MRFTIDDLRFTASALFVAVVMGATAAAETLCLTGATLHTVSGATIEAGEVWVQDGKITAVHDASRKAQTVRPPEAVVVNLQGLHLYPGLIALDTELGLREIQDVQATRDEREVGAGFNPEILSWWAVNPDSELLPVARANGIAYFEPAPQGSLVAGQSGLVALDGWTTEQMVFERAIGLHIYWPSFALEVATRSRKPEKSLEDQAKERRERVQALESFFAEAEAYQKARDAAAGKAWAAIPAWEAMLPYVRGERPLIIHADETRQIESAVTWARDGGRRVVIAGGRDAWRVAELLATNHIPVIYGRTFKVPTRDTESYDTQFRAPALLHQAGVKVALAPSFAPHSLVKNLPYDAAQAAAFGLPADEALKSITLYPAQIAGVAARLGSIEAGKVATLVATAGDILDPRVNVKRMWIGGREVSLENRHTRLYEKYRHRPAK
jgi:imidazolonepropionase-like amidohydrolase